METRHLHRMSVLWGISLTLGLGLMLVAIVQAPLRVHADVAAHLDFGLRIAEGQRAYIDFFDVLPTASYISAMPAYISEWLGVNALIVMQGWTLALLLASIITIMLLQRPFVKAQNGLIFVVPLALVVVSVWTLLGDRNNFAQREYLFVLLFMPGVIIRLRRWQGIATPRAIALILGILAALGTLIKPYFFAVLGIIEVYGLIRYRRWRALFAIETVGFISFCVVFGLYLVTLFDANTLDGIIAFGDYYPTGRTLDYYLARPHMQFYLVIHAIFWILRWWLRHADDNALTMGEAWSIFSLGGLASIVWQGRGEFWTYHWIILITGTACVAGLLVWAIGKRLLGKRADVGLGFASVVFMIGVGVHYWPNIQTLRSEITSQFAPAILTYTQPHDPVFILSVDMFSTYPVVLQTERKQVGETFVALPAAAGGDWYKTQSEANALFWTSVERTITEDVPRLIILDDPVHEALDYVGLTEALLEPHYALAEALPWDTIYYYVGDLPDPTTTYAFGTQFDLEAWQFTPSDTLQRCDDFTLTTVWQGSPAAIAGGAYSLSLVLTNAQGGVAQVDATPSRVETYAWRDGQRYADRRTLRIPCDLAAGRYSLLLTLYQPEVPGSNLFIQTADGGAVGPYLWLADVVMD